MLKLFKKNEKKNTTTKKAPVVTSVKEQREAVLALWNKEPFYFADTTLISTLLGISENLVKYYLEKEGLLN